jgi:hypothetical protein
MQLRPCRGFGRRPSTMEAWVQFQGRPCEIYGGQIGTGSGSSAITSGFPLPVIIPPKLHTHLSLGAGTVDPLKATVPRDSGSPRVAANNKIDMEPIRGVDGTEF